MLKKVECVCYPSAIRPRSSADSKADPKSSEVGEIQSSPPKEPPIVAVSLEGVQQAKGTTEAKEGNKEIAHGSDLPSMALKDPKDKEASQNMELVLATLPIPPKVGLKDVMLSITSASTQPLKDPKDKLVIKMKK